MKEDPLTTVLSSPHIHPNLKRDMRLLSESWEVGKGPIRIHTKSGAIYDVDSEGNVSGGSRSIYGGRLIGSTYRPGGPIRVRTVVVGLRMEISWDGKILCSSAVRSIERIM